MVQLYPHATRPNGPNRYWKLDSGTALSVSSLRSYLSEASFTTPKKITKSRLIELYIRCQHELLSYESLSLRELQNFAAQRAVPIGTKSTLHSLEALKKLLEKADNEATFKRFSELPPELRLMVFSHYFDSLVVLETPYKHQPPITLVSRTLRRESLPLFYERCSFTVGANCDTRTIPFKFVPDVRAVQFMRNTTYANLARVRSLRLEFHKPRAHIQLDLSNKDNPVVSVKIDRATRITRERLLSEVRRLAMGISAREGPLKLRVGDIEEMCEVIQKFCSFKVSFD